MSEKKALPYESPYILPKSYVAPYKKCTCKRKKCERHGDCKACKEHHKKINSLPQCEREKGIFVKKEKR